MGGWALRPANLFRMRRRAAGWLALLTALGGVAEAQTIRGQVVEATGGSGVGLGFVVLLGPDGKEVGRALADNGGRFVIRAPGAGRYRLRSERIAYRATTSAAFDLAADQVLDYRLEVTAIAIRLEEIRIAGETRCRVRPEEGRATATLWDEARKALAAVAWVETGQQLRAKVRTYERDLDPGLKVVREQSRVRSGMLNRGFRAVSPAQLAEKGYVEKFPDGSILFHGPDAQVLFSDGFLNTHCFRLEPPRDSTPPGLLGLGFQPSGGSRLPDISGVMWVDEKSAELRYVTYRYENHGLPIETEYAGGRVEFERLINGGWIVRRFWIRMPQANIVTEKRYSSISQAASGTGTQETRAELAGVTEQGGEVVEAFGPDGSRLASALGAATLAGAIFDSTRSMPLIGADVRLAGTDYSAPSGPGGAFELTGLPEGTYAVEFRHRDFSGWGLLPGPYLVTLRRGETTRIDLAVPPSRRLFQQLCPDVKGDTLGAVAGVLRDSATAQPVRDAVIQFNWLAYNSVRQENISARRLGVEVGTDSTGYFRACGLPVSQGIEALVFRKGVQAGPPVEIRVGARQIHGLDLVR